MHGPPRLSISLQRKEKADPAKRQTIDPSSSATTLAPTADADPAAQQQQQQQQHATPHTSRSTRVVSFAERYIAEMFLAAAAARARDIPGVGRVELAWVVNAAVPAPPLAAASAMAVEAEARGNDDGGEAAMDDGAGGAGGGSEREAPAQQQREEVDWDVADDDDDRWMK